MNINKFNDNSVITDDMWNDLNWGIIQKKVRKVQYRIYKAKKKSEMKKVRWLQLFMVGNKDAKLLATYTATTLNKGRKTAGVDKVKATSPSQKYALAMSLNVDGTAMPIRRAFIPKHGKSERRPLGIPVITDRAKQALVKLALEPEWEAVFEPNSYGFRPGRCSHDAIEAIFLALRHDTVKYVYDADIRKCFDRIDHDALLKKINAPPSIKTQIRSWLKAGIMEGYTDAPKSYEKAILGTPQGGIISPLLANIALHGLEEHLKRYVENLPIKPHPGANRGKSAKSKALSVVRYADDFVLIHRNKEILSLCINETQQWLGRMGLLINEHKSTLKDAREGFLFLGFQITMVRKISAGKYKVKIQPSKKSQTRILERIRGVIQKNKAVSSYHLIQMLRPIIIGWANYYRYCECSQIFSKMTHLIFQKLRAWVFRRDTRNGRLNVKQKYFPSDRTYKFDGSTHEDNWILVGQIKDKKGKTKEIYLPHMSWVKSQKHVKVLGSESPFNASLYWDIRSKKYSRYPVRIASLLRKQKGKCTLCQKAFSELDAGSWEVDHVLSKKKGGKDTYSNLQLVHKSCHIKKTKNLDQSNSLKYTFSNSPLSNLQEPDEVKVSRPDLKTGGS